MAHNRSHPPLTFSLLFNSFFLLDNKPYTEKKVAKTKCISDLDSGPSKTMVNAVLQHTSNLKKMTSSYIKQVLF